MTAFSKTRGALLLTAMLAMPMASSLSAQDQDEGLADDNILVQGSIPADLSGFPAGPEIDGFISARTGSGIQVTTVDGSNTMVALSQGTEIRSTGGFLGLNRNELGAAQLLNGLPVTVETVQWAGNLVATKVRLKNKDLKTAAMIRNGTVQQFAEHRTDIDSNTKAAEALRARMGDIDKYNIRGTTNVYFDTGKWNLSGEARTELCQAASEADAMENALLLVVGYTDSVGSQDYNQVLSERRAGRVVNFLQQECGWKPWRMLTPTGMAEADPLADNETAEGRRQNRRVSVNILVSKAVEETQQGG